MNSRACVCLFVFFSFFFLFVFPKSTTKQRDKPHEISSISFGVFSFLGKLIKFYYSSSYFFSLLFCSCLFVLFLCVCFLRNSQHFVFSNTKKNIYTYTNKLMTNNFFFILFDFENAICFFFIVI